MYSSSSCITSALFATIICFLSLNFSLYFFNSVFIVLKSVLSIQDIAALLKGSEATKEIYGKFEDTQTDAMVEVSSQLLFALENGDDLNMLALKFAAEANAKRAASRKILEYLDSQQKENK